MNLELFKIPEREFLIEKVLRPIEAAGFKAYFVGGCVRDYLLGGTPHDWDVCTNAQPKDLHKIFKKFSNVSKNSEQFGVTIVLVSREDESLEEVEIATFRKDETKGRHPKVSLKASMEEDASRRDFTINALYWDADGNVYDPTRMGLKDLEFKALRFVGDPIERLKEDPLRAFRFMRFLSQKGFKSIYTIEEIKSFTKDLDFSEVSKERILKEFKQILAGKYLIINWGALFATRVAEVTGIEELSKKMKRVEQAYRWHAEGSLWQRETEWGPEYRLFEEFNISWVDGKPHNLECMKGWKPVQHGNVWDHTELVVFETVHQLWVLDKSKFNTEDRFLLVMAALLHDVGKAYPGPEVNQRSYNLFEGTDMELHVEECVPKVTDHPQKGIEPAIEFCKNLRMSNEEIDLITYIVAHHMSHLHGILEHHSDLDNLKVIKHKYFDYLCIVGRADDKGSRNIVDNDRGQVDAILASEYFNKLKGMELPEPILTGKDLIAFGRKPGPLFKKMLDVAYHFQVDQCKTDKQELYRLVKNVELSKKEKEKA